MFTTRTFMKGGDELEKELEELIEAIFADMETNEKPAAAGDRKEHSQ